VREEVTFTKGRVIVRGKLHTRGKQKRADYVLYYAPNLPIAVIEAKDNNHTVGDGMQQGLNYAETLDVPYAISSNGDAFLVHDRTGQHTPIEQQLALDAFPTPAELWQRYCAWKGIAGPEKRVTVETPYYDDGSAARPRATTSSTLSTASSKPSPADRSASCWSWRPAPARPTPPSRSSGGCGSRRPRKRILFLVDRNILADQTKTNDFKPFGQAMTKISQPQVDKSFEIYLSLYQAVTGNEEEKNIYKQFSPDFFDLIIIDECHRGSAAEDSAWREILDYFAGATQIGLTATPKETKDVSNIHYFGEPVYTYSLRQGIDDGFLAPYKVVRIDIDKDLQGWRPSQGQTDKHGNLIEDRIYNQKDFDRSLVLEKRTELVAGKITEFLEATDPFAKTIVFCEDIDHAERMRQALTNLNPERIAENRKYIMRITGDEQEGKAELDNFIDPESRYPVIATTSKLMTTGVDAQTCKLIVLDQRIQSMTEFKQIIGRGTRINEDFDKYWFTIMDFKKATELFADPDFDGPPEQIYEPSGDDPPVPPDRPPGDDDIPPGETPPGPPFPPQPAGEKRIKYVVGGEVTVYVVAERVQYYGPDGKLITESLKDYTRKAVRREYASVDDFLRRWTGAERKKAVIDELETQGVLLEALAEEVGKKQSKAFDPFDLICHVAFDRPPLSRKERAEQLRKRDVFARYGAQARAVLDALLVKYADTGIESIEDIKILTLDPFSRLGTAPELVAAFGGKSGYLKAVQELEQQLYA
jgi:type I restriction enzyme R subunit